MADAVGHLEPTHPDQLRVLLLQLVEAPFGEQNRFVFHEDGTVYHRPG
jgi:hypothetical protein